MIPWICFSLIPISFQTFSTEVEFSDDMLSIWFSFLIGLNRDKDYV